MASDIEQTLKMLQAKKLQSQNILLERKLAGIVSKEQHEEALEQQKREILEKIGAALNEIPGILYSRRLILAKNQEAVSNVIGEWLEKLADG